MNNQFRRMSAAQALSGAGNLPVPTMPEQYIEDWWVENVNVLLLASGGTANATIQVQSDSAFKLVKLGIAADIAVAAQTESSVVVPLCTLQITDSGSGRNLFSAPVALRALFGNGQLPHILPVPRLFLPRSLITLQFANFSAASTYNLRMAFEGAKVFKLNGQW